MNVAAQAAVGVALQVTILGRFVAETAVVAIVMAAL